ncbi:ATP-grasp domain-containing protein [Streptomyces sp. NPDC097941]|uniref:ATP-grasp domain-containing protein n=1 Tax=Streptomyces sp. NPDC097941 TaxID=3155685 RepID=UPI0033220513
MARAALLLGAENTAAECIVRAAQQLDVGVHVATHRELYVRCRPQMRRELSGVVFTDFRSAEQAVDQLAEYCTREGIGAVAVSGGRFSPLAAALAVRIGAPGHSAGRAPAARNKWHMAQAMQRHGVPSAPTVALVSPEAAQQRLEAAGLDYPVVVKPVENTGSVGVSVVRGPAELQPAVRRALNRCTDTTYGLAYGAVALVQGYLEGPEYSVVSVLHQGNCTHLALTRKYMTDGREREETGHTVPADLDEWTTARTAAAVADGVVALGLRDGIAQTDLKLTADGPVLIEIGAGPPDGAVLEAIKHATGIDLARAYVQTVLGEAPQPQPRRSGAAALRYINTAAHGTFRGLTGLSLNPHLAAVRSYVEPGDVVGGAEVKHTRVGHAIVVAANPVEADRRAAAVMVSVACDVEA